MTEPKLTVGRVETWRPIDEAQSMDSGVWWLARQINERMAELFPPAPQPEAKAEPEEDQKFMTNRIWHAVTSSKVWPQAAIEDEIRKDRAAANARIAELVRERDEARAAEDGLRKWEINAFRAGVAAAKEACAKALEREAALESINFEHAIASHKIRCARVVRELDVDAPLTDKDKRLQEYADKTWGAE